MVIFLLFPFLFFFSSFFLSFSFFQRGGVEWTAVFLCWHFCWEVNRSEDWVSSFCVCVCVLSSFKMAAVSESIGPLRKPRGCFAPKSSGQFLAFLFLRNYPINFYFSRVAFSNCWAFKEEEEEEENADFFPVYTCGKNTGRWKTENH